MPRIDVHCHTIPPTFFARIREVGRGSSRYAEAARRIAEWPRVCNDPQMIGALDERVPLLDEAAIDVEIISTGVVPSMFFEGSEASAAVSQVINEEFAAACQRHPGRYRFWATLPLPHVPASADEFRRAARLPGFVGVLMPTSFGLPLDDPSLDDLYGELAEADTLVFVHPNGATDPGRYGRLGMESMLGWPADDTLALMELVLRGVLDRFPGVTVVTPHLSGTVLYLLGRIDRHHLNLPPDRRHTQELPSWYVKRMYHDSVTFLRPALDLARTLVGADHIVLGSDYPWQSRHCLGECLEVVNGLDWPEEELELVRGGNVQRLLMARGRW